jgi:ATP-dependent Clp endopeptidase proteolytic subunit ClpP
MQEILIYDEIDTGLARSVVEELKRAKAVTVRINSPGGSVDQGLAIFNALKAHPHHVTTQIDGFALSIASTIAMAGRRITMAKNALLMIHEPWTTATGPAATMTKTAEALGRTRDSLIQAYSRTGKPADELAALMNAETWLTAEEALKHGFVDEIHDHTDYAIAASFDLSQFKNAPAQRIKAMTTPIENAADIEARVLERESTRRTEISTLFGPFRNQHRDLLDQCLADPRCSPDAASQRLLAKLGEGAEPIAGPRIVAGNPSRMADFTAAASDALLIRSGIRLRDAHPAARDLVNSSILNIAESIASMGGGWMKDRSPINVLRAAHSTSDFPLLLANTANKALQMGYENEPASHRAWVRTVDVNDFKVQSRVQRSEAPGLLEVAEGGEYTYGTFGERSETYAISTWGRIFQITRQALVNDDLGAFTTLPQAFGAAAARKECDEVYSILTTNAAMGDGVALFHATHANLTASGTALSTASLGVARALMRKQMGSGGLGYLNVVPAFLIVPAALETAAEILVASTVKVGGSNAEPNSDFIRSLTVVVDPRLDTASATAWYLASQPSQVDTVELAYLRGQRGVFTEEDRDFETDAMKLKARLDFGCAAIDWKGLYKNPGA